MERSVVSYKGHITKSINDLKALMAHNVPSEVILAKRKSLETTVDKFKSSVLKWYQEVTPGDVTTRGRIARTYNEELSKFKNFQVLYKEWFGHVYNQSRSLTPFKVYTDLEDEVFTPARHASSQRLSPMRVEPAVTQAHLDSSQRLPPTHIEPAVTLARLDSSQQFSPTRVEPAVTQAHLDSSQRFPPTHVEPAVTLARLESDQRFPPICVEPAISQDKGSGQRLPPIRDEHAVLLTSRTASQRSSSSHGDPIARIRKHTSTGQWSSYGHHVPASSEHHMQHQSEFLAEESSQGRSFRSSTSLKRSKAHLKVERLELEQRFKEEQMAIELEEEQKILQVEKERLKMQKQLLQAKLEAKELDLQAKGSEGSASRWSTPSKSERRLSREKVEEFLSSQDKLPQSEKKVPFHSGSYAGDHVYKSYVKGMENIAEGLKKLDLPKREFLSFDGSPTKYPLFIKNFEANIANVIHDNNLKLSYLIQYCSGKARDAIENCVILPEGEGYPEALKILETHFGQRHTVVRAFIDKVVQGPQIKASESEKLLKLARDMRNCLLNSKQMGYEADVNSFETLKRVVLRLPVFMQAKWAEDCEKMFGNGRQPTFSGLTEFIERKAKCANTEFGKLVGMKPAEARGTKKPQGAAAILMTQGQIGGAQVSDTQVQQRPFRSSRQDNYEQPNKYNDTEQSKPCCLFCEGTHEIARCFKFRDQPYAERLKFVRSKKLCDNCMKSNHFAKKCKAYRACLFSGCSKRHHSLLHPVVSTPVPDTVEQTVEEPTQQISTNHVMEAGSFGAVKSKGSKVLLRILPARVSSADGTCEIETYAFLDEGSDTTLCEKSLTEELGINGKPTSFSLTTINAEKQEMKGNEVQLKVRSLDGDGEVTLDRVWTVDKLPISRGSIPTADVIESFSHLRDIKFPQLDKQVTILIGSDVPEAHWVFEERRGRRKQPYAVKTMLGWTLIGPVGPNGRHQGHVNFVAEDEELLATKLERMYNTDVIDVPTSKTPMSIEDRRALRMMESTVKSVDGHYQLSLPWKLDLPYIPDNRETALKRLSLLKRRLLKDKELHKKYAASVEEYISLGHARKLPEDQSSCGTDRPIWFLPHHPVFHPQKPGKVRVVFDCAAKHHGVCLNDQLLQGPDLTNSLIGVLLRFRQHPVAFMADVEKMFHQVKVTPEDCNALRFLWWQNGDLSSNPVEYQMLVHIFGAKSSPSCASFALRRAAEDNRSSFSPNTIETVMKNFYVDDCVKSVMTTEEAQMLVKEIPEVLSKGGFHLTKWISNERDVLVTIPEKEHAPSMRNINIDLEDLPIERALGITWNVEEDTFSFRTVNKTSTNTRRGILSVTSSVYDPLGLAAPMVLPAKRILQNLCKQEYGWDDVVPEEELETWKEWSGDIDKLTEVAVPRCIKPQAVENLQSVQIHHFADASSEGYGAATYLRTKDNDGNVSCNLILGKSRVAPLKTITIPKLELTAATIAIKLQKQIEQEFEIPVQEVHYWTDSVVVLQYIRNKNRRFQIFVANRLAMIHDVSTPSQWHYVNTELNPADYASRGIKASDQLKLKVWLQGPEFLQKDEDSWPAQPDDLPNVNELEGYKVEASVHHVHEEHAKTMDEFFSHFSSWYKLQKATAWLLRFKNYLRRRMDKSSHVQLKTGELKVEEISEATEAILKYVQRQHFEREMQELQEEEDKNSDDSRKSGRRLRGASNTSPLRKLFPYMKQGLIRVGGRLQRAKLSSQSQHPIVLPGKHHVTNLIIRYVHHQEGHMGVSQVLASIRKKFWILQGGAAVRRVVQKCIKCRRWKAKPEEQLMAPLPLPRVTPLNPPFSFVGIDYFGPVYVKQKRSQVKRYGCVFTCLTMRAVHIEIAHELTTDSFLQALSRFVSRRGPPKEVYSDNGTNLRGAEEEVKKALQTWNQSRIEDQLRKQGIQWHFNPPKASHAGGIWERMIRSIRNIMHFLLDNQSIYDEVLLTVMAEVEKILNDRPLTPVTDDPNDLEPLTPNKLLLVYRNPCTVSEDVSTPGARLTQKWRQVKHLSDEFWRRWTIEYMASLQERQKWQRPRRNLQKGDLVLMVDEQLPRGRWPMGIISDVVPDKYGLVRHIIVTTGQTSFKRDVRKVCLLEAGFTNEPDVSSSH